MHIQLLNKHRQVALEGLNILNLVLRKLGKYGLSIAGKMEKIKDTEDASQSKKDMPKNLKGKAPTGLGRLLHPKGIFVQGGSSMRLDYG